MDNILFTSYNSLFEAKILGFGITYSFRNFKYLINKNYLTCYGKTIIINSKISFSLDKLSINNKVISRYPLKGAELVPYEVPNDTSEVPDDTYSLRILNDYMMNSDDPDDITELSKNHYLIGVNTDFNGYLTSIGYKLTETNLNRFTE